MYKGAVFFDYDGTLANKAEGIKVPTKRTINAIKKLRENNYLAILSTGRALSYAPDTGIDFDGFSTSNGNYIIVHNKVIFEKQAKKEDIVALINCFEEMKLSYGMDHPVKSPANSLTDERFLSWIDTFGISLSGFELMKNEVYGYKLFVNYDNNEQLEILRKKFEGKFVFDAHDNHYSSDCTPTGTSKATGILKISEYFNIPIENTYAIGDGQNDYDALKTAGHGIAMGIHSSILDDVCEMVTKRVCDEGIEFALKKYKLI